MITKVDFIEYCYDQFDTDVVPRESLCHLVEVAFSMAVQFKSPKRPVLSFLYLSHMSSLVASIVFVPAIDYTVLLHPVC